MGIEKVTQQQRFTSPNIVIGGDNIPIDTGLSVYGKITTTDNIRSGNDIHASGNLSTDGTITGNSLVSNNGVTVNNGNLDLTGGSLVNGDAINANSISSNGTITGNYLVSNNGVTVNNGNLSVPNGTITGNSLVSNNGVTVNNGSLNVPNGTITGNSLVSNNGVTVNNGSLNVPNGTITGNSLVSNNGLTVNNGNLSVPNGTVTATSVNASNITVTNSITNTNNTPFISPQDLLPGTGATEGSVLRYDGEKWQPYKLYSAGIGQQHKLYYDTQGKFATNTAPTIAELSAFNFYGTVFNPATITGIAPWRKVPKIEYLSTDTEAEKAAKFLNAATQWYATPPLYKTISITSNGMTSQTTNGTTNTAPTLATMNYSPTLSIQGVRADGTIRGRLGNVRVTATNVVTGCEGGNVDPNTGMVTGGTIVPLVTASRTGTNTYIGPTIHNGATADIMRKPASNGHFSNMHSTETSAKTIGPQSMKVSILSAGLFRQMHPECGGNQNTATGDTGVWNIDNEQWWKYSIPHYSTPIWFSDVSIKGFGIQTYITLEYRTTDYLNGKSYMSAADAGTVMHYFTYTIETSMWGADPRYSKHIGELRVYDDVFNPNVSYNLVIYPPKQPAGDLDNANAIPHQLFEAAYLVDY